MAGHRMLRPIALPVIFQILGEAQGPLETQKRSRPLLFSFEIQTSIGLHYTMQKTNKRRFSSNLAF